MSGWGANNGGGAMVMALSARRSWARRWARERARPLSRQHAVRQEAEITQARACVEKSTWSSSMTYVLTSMPDVRSIEAHLKSGGGKEAAAQHLASLATAER